MINNNKDTKYLHLIDYLGEIYSEAMAGIKHQDLINILFDQRRRIKEKIKSNNKNNTIKINGIPTINIKELSTFPKSVILPP